ncbi:MAG: CRISPR-associated endonuclease Cas2 [Desulfurella sp.]|uniref:CRISPR-associated endonuclease Cas2 n=1 Tax=Desulfurella sp. TaxID=1962857 RepID=UPI003D0D8491
MFVVTSYDISSPKGYHILSICRRYLTWVQKSLFEGNISEKQLKKMVQELQKEIENDDSIVIYTYLYNQNNKIIIGKDKSKQYKFI